MSDKRLRKTFRENPANVFVLIALYLLVIAAAIDTIDKELANSVATYGYYSLIIGFAGLPLLNIFRRRRGPRQILNVQGAHSIGYHISMVLIDNNLGIIFSALLVLWSIASSPVIAKSEYGLIVAMFCGLMVILFEVTLLERVKPNYSHSVNSLL